MIFLPTDIEDAYIVKMEKNEDERPIKPTVISQKDQSWKLL